MDTEPADTSPTPGSTPPGRGKRPPHRPAAHRVPDPRSVQGTMDTQAEAGGPDRSPAFAPTAAPGLSGVPGLSMDVAGGAGAAYLEPGASSRSTWEALGKDVPGAADAAGARVGGYRIVRLIGEGGMGAVYEAEQQNPRRAVALKVIRPGLAGPSLLARFMQEAEALGRLRHEGIAQVYEAGTADVDGRPQPFFAMELVRGPGGVVPAPTLTQYADEHELDAEARLELLAKICDAVHHAHQKGVIHRDLKPSNILVDESVKPKILDFGVARATDPGAQAVTMHTGVGQLVGTLPYMSPEQASGNPDDLDMRSDVYALGVIGYELLAGRLPHDVRGRPVAEAARLIQEEEPSRLSVADKSLRGDVETIIAKALEKDKDRRYQSAAELAADIRRYLTDEPVLARPASTWYQLVKFSRRNRALVTGVAAAFVALLLGVVGTTWQAVRATAAQAEARASAADAREQARVAKLNEEEANRQKALANLRLAGSLVFQGDRLTLDGRIPEARAIYDEAWTSFDALNDPRLTQLKTSPFPAELGLWNVDRLLGAPSLVFDHQGPVYHVAVSADARRALSAGEPAGGVKLWDLVVGGPSPVRLIQADGSRGVALGPDGSTAVFGGRDGPLTVWNVVTGRKLRTLGGPPGARSDGTAARPAAGSGAGSGAGDPRVECLALSGDGTVVFAAYSAGPAGDAAAGRRLKVWKVADGSLVHDLPSPFPSAPVLRVEIAHDGRAGLVVGTDAVIAMDLVKGKATRRFDAGAATGAAAARGDAPCAALLSDGRRVLRRSAAGLELWDAANNLTARTLAIPGDEHLRARSLVVSAGGQRFAAVAGDRPVFTVFDLAAGGRKVRTFAGHTDRLLCLALSADGRTAVSGGRDSQVMLWDLAPAREVVDLAGATGAICGGLSPDGRMALIATRGGKLGLWDTATGRPLRTFERRPPAAPRGRRPSTPQPSQAPAEYVAVALSPDRNDRQFSLAHAQDGSVTVWEVGSGEEKWSEAGPVAAAGGPTTAAGGGSPCYAFSPDGRLLLRGGVRPRGSAGGSVLELRDTATWQVVHAFTAAIARATHLAFAPDGRRAVSRLPDGSAIIWNVEDGRQVVSLPAPSPAAGGGGGGGGAAGAAGPADGAIVFSPDARFVAAACPAGVIRVWDAATGKEVKNFHHGHTDAVHAVAVSDDAGAVLTGSTDGSVKVWDVATGKEIRTFALAPTASGNAGGYTHFALAADVRGVLACGADGSAFWDFTRPARRRAFGARLAAARTAHAQPPVPAAALHTFGEWYAFLGIPQRAADLLEKAQAGGARVSPLLLARCYWQLNRPDDAQTQFRRAIIRKEAPPPYLGLCAQAAATDGMEAVLAADSSATTSTTTAPPARVPSAFWFHSADAPAGRRQWSRTADGNWQQKSPGGQTETYRTIGRGEVSGAAGTLTRRAAPGGREVFIPDDPRTPPSARPDAAAPWTPLDPMHVTEWTTPAEAPPDGPTPGG